MTKLSNVQDTGSGLPITKLVVDAKFFRPHLIPTEDRIFDRLPEFCRIAAGTAVTMQGICQPA